MALSDRIQEILDAGFSRADLARFAGVTPAAVTHWLNGSTKEIASRAAAGLQKETRYNAVWISTGTGAKQLAPVVSEFAAAYHVHGATDGGLAPILAWEHESDLPEGEFVFIPRLDISLSAGNGHEQVAFEFTQKQPQAFRADWIRAQHLRPSKLASMTAKGNSMEPRIFDGDALVVDTSQMEIVDGKVYALWYEGGERVKRLSRLPGGGLRIRSDNEREHPEIVLGAKDLQHVRIIGRVVHVAGQGGL